MQLECQNKKCGHKRATAIYPNGCCNRCYPESKEGKRDKKQMADRKKKSYQAKLREWRKAK